MSSPDDPQWGLEQAALAFAARCRQQDPEPVAEFLARHEPLRPWLEPMLDEGTPDTEPLPSGSGDRLGPYRLLRELGRGGMGVVHEARCGDDPTPVALKLLPGFLGLREASVARFRREADVARRLDHAGVVRVLDAGNVGDTHYLAMAFVVGAPLDQVLLRLGEQPVQAITGRDLAAAVCSCLHVPTGSAPPALDPSTFPSSYVACVARLAAQIADALAHAHAAGVIHRDVKPSNLLLGADGVVVLTDLGLARDADGPALTITGDFAGTPHYVSPEQAMARRVRVDHRTDLFSLGSTLYELLTLRRAFDGDSTQEVLGRILTKEPPDMRRHNPGLPEDLVNIVGKLLEKDPDRRYADADALAADLRAFLEFRPVSARRASTMTRVWRWTRREPAKAALLLVLALAIPVVTAGAGYLYARADDIRAGQQQRRIEAIAEAVDQGYLAVAQEDAAAGIRRFEDALALDPHCSDAQIGLVLTLLRGDGPEPALQRLEGELAAQMPAALCDLLRFSLLKRLQRDDDARAALARVPPPQTACELVLQALIGRDRGPNTGTDVLGFLERAVLVSDRPLLWRHQYWAVFADAAGDAGSCRRCADNLLLNWPDAPVARYFACVALRRVDGQRAERLARDSVAAHPDLGIAHAALGMVLSARGDLPAATAAFAEAARLAPAIPSFRYALGKARYDAGDPTAALADFQQACSASPRFVDAWVGLGMAQRKAGRAEAALASLRQAVQLQPSHAEARFQLGQQLMVAQQPAAGLAELQLAVDLNAGDPNKWHHLASARFVTGDEAGGLQALRAAVAAMPTYERAHSLLAMYLQKSREPTAARAALQAWVEALPRSLNGWLQLGSHCVDRELPPDQRDAAAAVWAARRALDLSRQQSAGAWLLLGEAEADLGRRNAAITALQRSLDATDQPLGAVDRSRCERRLGELRAAGDGR